MAEAAVATPPRRKLPGRLVIMLAGVAALLAAGGGAWFLLAAGHGDAEAAAPPPPEHAIFRELPEMIVRLDGGRGSYLKLVAVLDLDDEAARARIEQVEPRLMDSLQTYLIELGTADLIGNGRLDQVRQELLRRTNAIVPASTHDILFKSLIVQ